MAASDPHAPAVDLAVAMVTAPSTASDWLIVLPVVVPLVTGAILVMVRHATHLHRPLTALGLALLFGIDLMLLGRVVAEGPLTMMMGAWKPPFGIAFTVDLLGATFATTAAFVALVATATAGPAINTAERRYGFYPFLMLLMTGVTGAFLTGDIFNLYVWFEVLLISSFGLLVLGSEKAQIDGTVKYGLLNLVATTFFLIGVGLLYGTLGTLNMADIAAKARAAGPEAPLVTIAGLFIFAFAMKAAAFPLNFWLPASYHTPTATVSALFAGLLTKVGVYALLKVTVLLLGNQTGAYTDLLVVMAAATMIVGALGAIAGSDLRRILGWLVISGIGSMLIGVAVGSPGALTGSIFYAVQSMLVMTALYLAAGVVEARAGTGDVRRLGGFYAAAPLFSGVVLVLLFAVAGLPPFSGFWPKAILVESSLAVDRPGLAAAVLVSGFLQTLAVGRIWLYVFWRGGPEGTPDGAIDLSGVRVIENPADRVALVGPVIVLTAAVVLIGLVPTAIGGLAEGAASGLLDPAGFTARVLGAPAP
ncbi:Na+/H+ antiporter subunit D [Chthonobacter rhizosphaerae]|uniref:Na+/H+ antiporter subunit D n=1 Tax=Chthonobacter rhizosphaerae TaxID=2735553 RepID=UPI0015EFD6E0|nr:Na+/H+ antiporter subunit D [Chthonobacter rhizosphaerae]